MTYEEIVDYIAEIPRFSKNHSLLETRGYLDALGAPDDVLWKGGTKIIHVAGTNGKGSVCNYLAEIFRAAGFHVGLFISPHLVDIRERMLLDGEMIPKEEFVRSFQKVTALTTPHRGPAGDIFLPEKPEHFTYFEFLFLMAMVWYGEKKPDVLILETGLGGRLDATNCVRHKSAAVITRIGMDHCQYLGNTISAIAGEKAGIMKENVPTVVLEEPREALEVFKEKAEKLEIPLFIVHLRDFVGCFVRPGCIDFSFCYRYDSSVFTGTLNVRTRLSTSAVYQEENASLSAAAAGLFEEEIRERSGRSAGEIIGEGLSEAFWPGRMEEILPGVYIDGGHNPDGIRAFLESVRQIPVPPGGRRVLLFSAAADKQVSVMADEILRSGLFDRIVAAPMGIERSIRKEDLVRIFEGQSHPADSSADLSADHAAERPAVSVADLAADAFRTLTAEKNDNELIFAAGSLYLVGILDREEGRKNAYQDIRT